MSGTLRSASDSRTLGPFLLEEQLSEGAMGAIWRARHLASGRQVAVKTVRAPPGHGEPGRVPGATERAPLAQGARERAPQAHHLWSLRRELHALRRLRHPGVVRVLEDGVEGGLPWYAMELLDGQPLRAHMGPGGRHAPGPEGVGRSLLLVQRLCRALAYVHGEGVVHRDLKPENVVLSADGAPVLVDFGLALTFAGGDAREVLTLPAGLEGSAGYLAPEQIRGDLVDARADLYSLGCILYELLTGRLPFTAPGYGCLRQHLQDAPVPPSVHAPWLPAGLDALVLSLLAKAPAERLGYAEDVARALAALGGLEAPSHGDPGPLPRFYLYRPGLSGREDAVAALERLLQQARTGQGGGVLLGGESGAGKTRLALEAARLAQARGFRVISGECQPLDVSEGRGQGAPLQPFLPLLHAAGDHCRAAGEAEVHALLGAAGPVLVDVAPSLAQLPGMERLPAPPAVSPTAAVERLQEAVAQVALALSRRQPLLLVLDDLQWADALTLSTLVGLVRTLARASGGRLLVLGTYRAEEVGAALEPLLREPALVQLSLGRLETEAVSRLAGDMLALASPPAGLVERLTRHAGGNPFFVAEVLRDAVARGLLRREGGRWQLSERHLEEAPDVAPARLRALVQTRLERLGTPAFRLARAAAVLGREFDAELLPLLVETEEGAAVGWLEWLEELLARRIVEEGPTGQLRFAHDILRETAYDTLAAPERVGLHRRAAEVLEAQHAPGAPPPALLPALVHHWEVAGDAERTLVALERAAAHAAHSHAHAQAVDYYQRALALAARQEAEGREAEGLVRVAPERLLRWRYRLAESAYAAGDLALCGSQMEEALRLHGQPLPRTQLGWGGRLLKEAVVQLLHRGWPGAHPPRLSSLAEEAVEAQHAVGRLVECFYWRQQPVAMLALTLAYVNLAEQARRPGVVQRHYAHLGYFAALMRLPRLAAGYFARAQRGERGPEDWGPVGFALTAEAIGHVAFARWDAADACAARAVELLGRLGDRTELEIALSIPAQSVFYTGRFAETERQVRHIRDSARVRGHRQHLIWCAYAMGRSLIPRGRLEEAHAHLEEAVRLLEGQDDRASSLVTHGLMATRAVHAGDVRAACEAGQRVLALARGAIPTVFLEWHGYEGAAQAFMAAWEQGALQQGALQQGALQQGALQQEGLPVPASLARAQAREACTLLDRFARLYPLARPAALRCRGRERLLSGRTGKGLALLRRSVEVAERQRMPYEAAQSLLALGAAEAPGVREGVLGRAQTLLRELECPLLEARAAGLLRQA